MRQFLPQLLMMFVGGLVASIGSGQWARSRRGRGVLERLSGATMAGFGLLSFAAMVGAIWWMVRRITGAAGGTVELGSPWLFLGLGVAIGLPMALPQVLTIWNRHRPEKVVERERKAALATREDREGYARELLDQIRDATPEPRSLDVSTRGEEGRVLWFEGELGRDEGERLVHALRADLKEVGFRRVETRGPKGNWWTKV